MDYLGLFCLGVFAGAITTIGLRRIQALTDWRQALVVTLPVLLSSAAMVLVDRFRYLRFGDGGKLIASCRHYMQGRDGVWNGHGTLRSFLFSGTT